MARLGRETTNAPPRGNVLARRTPRRKTNPASGHQGVYRESQVTALLKRFVPVSRTNTHIAAAGESHKASCTGHTDPRGGHATHKTTQATQERSTPMRSIRKRRQTPARCGMMALRIGPFLSSSAGGCHPRRCSIHKSEQVYQFVRFFDGSLRLPTSRLQTHASRWVHGPGSMRAPSVAVPFFLSQQLVDQVQQLCIVPVEHPSRFEHGQALPGEGHPSSLADRYG
jgi:hypothetical protein